LTVTLSDPATPPYPRTLGSVCIVHRFVCGRRLDKWSHAHLDDLAQPVHLRGLPASLAAAPGARPRTRDEPSRPGSGNDLRGAKVVIKASGADTPWAAGGAQMHAMNQGL